MQYAVIVEVDNSRENPDQGRRELREDLVPAMKQMPGFVTAIFMTDYEKGRGLAVMVFENRELADQIAGGLTVGNELRNSVIIIKVQVMEAPATA
jgi:hypothetical protein